MGDLRDQLRKAKLLSKKDDKRLAHEQRVERKQKGRQGLEAEQQQRDAELRALRDADREQNRLTQQEVEEQRRQQEELAACRAILQQESRRAGPGTLRFFFEIEDGWLPWLEVSPIDQRQLQAGMLTVVRTGPVGTHTYRLLATELARRVSRVLPEVVVWAPRGVA